MSQDVRKAFSVEEKAKDTMCFTKIAFFQPKKFMKSFDFMPFGYGLVLLANPTNLGHETWKKSQNCYTGEFTKRIREMSSQLFVCREIDR